MGTGWLDTGDQHIQSIVRCLSLIRAFQPGREQMTMAQVALACGLTRAGARRILLTLKDLGYVGLDGRNFFLTARVLELGHGYSSQSLWQAARPALQSIVDEINETASAGVLEDFECVYTVRIRSSRVLQWELVPGAHVPTHATAIGRVLLAGLPDYLLSQYLRQVQFVRYTDTTVVDAAQLTCLLKDVRNQGWCYVVGEVDESAAGVAVPLTDSDGNTRAALSVGSSTVRHPESEVRDRIVPLLKNAAAEIGRLL
jgi:IclR family pca regulon transcriptional regulator